MCTCAVYLVADAESSACAFIVRGEFDEESVSTRDDWRRSDFAAEPPGRERVLIRTIKHLYKIIPKHTKTQTLLKRVCLCAFNANVHQYCNAVFFTFPTSCISQCLLQK